jgi:predicted nucleic acid-binding protein
VTYLVDTSVVVRLRQDRDLAQRWRDAIRAGRVAICPPVEVELTRAAASKADRDDLHRALGAFTWQPVPQRVWEAVAHIQDALVDRAQHRGPSVVDLLVAATAHAWGLTVLHVDSDFDTMAGVIDLRTQRADR